MNFNASIPYVDPIHLQYMKLTDLTDYYVNGEKSGFIFCQICKFNIERRYVFEHSITKRHKYNKLLFGIAQGLSSNFDMDFIVLYNDRLQCRYCDSMIIDSDREYLVVNHIQDLRHRTMRQYYIDRTDAGRLLKPLDTLISYAIKIKKRTNATKQTTQPSRDMSNVDRINALQNPGFSLNIGQGNLQQHAVALNDKEERTGIESRDCIRVGESATGMCTLCGVDVPYNPHNMDMHVNGKRHKKVLNIVSELPYFISTVKNGTRTCTICLIEVPNVHRYIKEHIQSKMHKDATSRLVQSTSKNSENKVTSNIDQSNVRQYSRFFTHYENERKEEPTKRSTIRENWPCMCPYCVLSLAKGIDFVGVHPNCTKNRRPTVQITKFQDLESETRSFRNQDNLLHRFRRIDEQRSEPIQPLRYRNTGRILTNFRETNHIGLTTVRVQESESLSFILLKILTCIFFAYVFFINYSSSRH